MKKLNYFLLGAAALTLASCSQEDVVAPNGDGNVNITVKLPADMGTRALSDGLKAENLHIAVYDAADNTFVFDDLATFGGALQTTVSLNLPQNKNFNIAFFAVSEAADGTLYQWKDQDTNPCIYVDYANYGTAQNLADDYDCFFKLENISTGSGAVNKEVYLTRPVAQINWGTNDLSQGVVVENAFGENGKYIVSNFTMKKYYNNFGILTGDVIGDPISDGITISGLATPASTEESANWAFPVDPTTYKYISMQYVLAPATQGTVYDLNLDVHNTQGTIDNEDIEVNSAPVQANFRTNIYGALLTNPNEFTVIKDPNWGIPDYDPSLELAAQRGGYFTLEHDFTVSNPLVFAANTTINLNGFNINVTNTNNEANENIQITNGANVTFTGNGTISNVADTYAPITVYENSKLTIESGVTVKAENNSQAILIASTGGTVYIKGGYFEAKPYNGTYFTLNCNDQAYNQGTANFVVTGGTFVNFNPAESHAENPAANFVPTGYKVVESTSGSNTLYTVVAEDTAVATDQTSLINAINAANGTADIYLVAGTYNLSKATFKANTTYNFTGENAETTIINNLGYVSTPNSTLNIQNISLDVEINTTIGTSLGFNGASQVNLNNCIINGEYHAFTGNQNITNCVFNFVPESTRDGKRYNMWFQTTGNVTVSNCEFNNTLPRGILVVGNTTEKKSGNLTVTNCTFNADEYVSDKAAVEIHSEGFTSAGTLTISGVTYSPNFGAGLWQEINNNTELPTYYYTVIVNGQIVQQPN